MAKKETILIRLDIDEADAKKKIVENTTAIRNYAAQNRDLAKALKDGTISEQDYSRALIANKQAVQNLTAENKQLELSVKASENSVEGLRAQIALLTKQANAMDLGSEEFAEAQAKLKKLNDELIRTGEDRSDFRANVGNYKSAAKGFSGSLDELEGKLNSFTEHLGGVSPGIGNLGTSLKAAFGPAAIVAGVGLATAAVIKLKMEIDATREQVNLLTGATGDALDEITAKVSATSSTFDKDFNETLLTANTVSAQFGISVQEATDLIQKGFVNGADASGNFLADLTEFSPQFNAIGLSADQAIAIMAQQPESGVFSNKGIDAIKEAGIRLKEMPQATKDALDAIGLSSSTIQKQIEAGTLTSFEAIQQVSNKLSELPDGAQVTAQAVADIFGGAGQDAGLAYLRTLKDVNTNLDGLTEGAGEFAKANLQIVDAQERIDLLFNQILGGGGNMFKNLKGMALDFVANALEFIVNGTIEIINYFRNLYNESLLFRGSIQYIKVGFENTWAAIKLIFNNFVDQLKNAGALIKAIFTGNFSAIPELLQNAFTSAVDNVKDFGTEVADNYKNAIAETLEPAEILEPIKLTTDEAVTAFYGAGLASGEAFNEGVKMTREEYLKDQQAFLQAQLLRAEKNSQTELDLKLRLIEIGRDIELTEEGLTANQKLLIQAEAFVAQQEAQKEHYEALKAAKAQQLAEEIQAIEDGETRKTLALQLQLLQRQIDEQTFNENLFAIREEALELELDQLEEGTLAKIEKEVELAELRAEHLNEVKAKEIETSNLLRQTEIDNDAAKLQSAQALADGVVQLAGAHTAAAKIAVAISKGLALAEMTFNLQQELAANAAAGAKISAQAPPATIPAGVAYTTTRNILAGVRYGVGLAKIGTAAIFEHGGQAFAENLAFSGGSIPRSGGMITGLPHGQGGVKFSMGGSRIGEADGRKGEAYIVNTRKNPTLKALASAINVAGGGRSFFNAGGVAHFANGGVASGVNAGALLQPAAVDFKTLLENLPTPVVLVDDIVNGTNQKIQVETGAIL